MGFSQRFKQAMERKGVQVKDLAAQMPVHPMTVTKWRAGFVPGPVHLARVASLLDTTTGYLRSGEGGDPMDWPEGMTVGVSSSGEVATGKGLPLRNATAFDTISGSQVPPDSDPTARSRRDPFEGLGEPPVLSKDASTWTAYDVTSAAFRNFIKAKWNDGKLVSPEDMAFWSSQLDRAHAMDRVTVAHPEVENGHRA